MITVLLALALTEPCQSPGPVLPTIEGRLPSELYSQWLESRAHSALDARMKKYEAIQSVEDIEQWQKKRREFFHRQLGGFPKRTPLNAQVVGKLQGDRHRIEKVLFESQPNHHVSAVLYLPEAEGPYPGVLVPCGHSVNGKAAEAYQRVCILLAQHGMAALCYDPIGQGERSQVLTEKGKPRYSSTLEHTLTGTGSILLGKNTATFRVFDGMRAIDYLVSRPDMDATRIGCTGNSGGGTLTSFLMALDDRIACAAPSCYLTSLGRLIDTIGPQDAEQNVFGQIGYGMDHADYILMRAPKPTLMCTATRDFFDIQGSWDTFRQAKRAYTRMGLSERVSLAETDATHGFSTQLRVAAVRWMRRWLLNKDDAIVEADFPIWKDEQLQCTPDGQVLLLPDERSVFDINKSLAQAIHNKRQQRDTSDQQLREQIRKVTGIRPLKDLPKATVTHPESNQKRAKKFIARLSDGRMLPGYFYPGEDGASTVLFVPGEGIAKAAEKGGAIEKLVEQGHRVVAVDLSGLGETTPKVNRNSWAPLFGADWKQTFLAYLLGESVVKIRAEEILVVADGIKQLSGHAKAKIKLVANGKAGIPALHTAALEPELFEVIEIQTEIDSWMTVFEAPTTPEQLVHAVHGAFDVYDLPVLRKLAE